MCKRRRHFKNRLLQAVYDHFRRYDVGPDRIARLKQAGSMGNAYANGVRFPDQRCSWSRGSPGYAAWAAGVDNVRCAGADGRG